MIPNKEINNQMAMKEITLAVPKEKIINQIYYVRGHKVMLDLPRSLANPFAWIHETKNI